MEEQEHKGRDGGGLGAGQCDRHPGTLTAIVTAVNVCISII